MLLTNFRVAISWAMKQPLYYVVKVLGLALGIMSLALLVAYVDFVGKYDAHIPARDQIYRVVAEYVNRESGAPVRPGNGSITWIEPFRNEYGDMFDSAGVLLGRNGVFAHETTVFDEEYYFADTQALELFNLELLEGSTEDALAGPNKVLLSQSAALKYFGTTEQVVGRSLLLDQNHTLGVSGVFRDLPRQVNFPMDVLVSYETSERVLSAATLRSTLWILHTGHTLFVRFSDPAKAQAVNADLHAFTRRRSPEQDLEILERNAFTLKLQPLTEIYLDPLTGVSGGSDLTRRNTYYGILLLSALIILGACVNYVSLTLGQLQLRLKELGVRTSFGATKSTLVIQLLVESLLVSAPAILLSANLLYLVTPAFAAVIAVPMEIADVMALEVWGTGVLLVFVVCAFVSAAPVMFSSADAIKSGALRAQAARFSWRTASAIIFLQFALSTVSALMVLGIYLQVSLLQNVDAGFDTKGLVVSDARFDGPANSAGFEALKQELARLPAVEAIATQSVNPPGTGGYSTWISATMGEPGTPMSNIRVDPEFLETWDIPLIAGRNFSRDLPSELVTTDAEPGRNFGILMTRSATRRLGYGNPEDALGEQYRYGLDSDGRTYTVIGVVEDFRISPIVSDERSIAVLLGSIEPMRSFALRLREGSGQEAVEAIRTVWNRHIPGVPFNLRFMSDVINSEIDGRTQSLALAASLATLVFFCTALIGIYAQASFVCERHAKSIAIRKVLGSSKRAILALLLKQFTVPVLASFALALPVALYFLREFYSSFQQTPGFPAPLYALCLACITGLALVTVLTHCRKAAAEHPIHALRFE